MKVWITKYALSSGIQTYDNAKVCTNVSMDMIEIPKQSSVDLAMHFHGEGKDWHRTEEAAKVRAEEMRFAKIASVKKQLNKLEQMSFA